MTHTHNETHLLFVNHLASVRRRIVRPPAFDDCREFASAEAAAERVVANIS